MNSIVRAAIRDYHALLDSGYLASAEETLARELEARKLRFGGAHKASNFLARGFL